MTIHGYVFSSFIMRGLRKCKFRGCLKTTVYVTIILLNRICIAAGWSAENAFSSLILISKTLVEFSLKDLCRKLMHLIFIKFLFYMV